MTIFLGQEKPSLEDLAHHGVKGMHWGVRRDSGGVGGHSGGKPPKLTRKEVKAEKNDFYQKKAERVIATAMKDHNSLIKVRTYEGDTVLTGKEFSQHLANGGMMNIKYTDVYAQQGLKNGKRSGAYILNENANQKFVRSDKKK